MPSPDAAAMTWTASARAEEAGPLRRRVTAYAGELGMPAARLGELALAVGEAIANAVVHAYRDAPLGSIVVTAGHGRGEMFVAVSDRGCGLVPRSDSPGLGLGLALISQIADTLRILERVGGGTEVRMTFALPLGRKGYTAPEGGSP